MIDEPHEIILAVGALVALLTLAAKIRAMACRRDGRNVLRLLAALTCAYLAAVWGAALFGLWTYVPASVLLLVPAVSVLLGLELAHSILEW